MTILTTCCYLKKNGETLLLFRNKKENDINQGKWIGIGGKIEAGESPLECVYREFLEETGLSISEVELKAYITFPGLYHGQDEGMFLYLAKNYTGELTTQCTEGELLWVEDTMIPTLPMWEGDTYFDEWLSQPGFVEAKFTYQNNRLVERIIKRYQ